VTLEGPTRKPQAPLRFMDVTLVTSPAGGPTLSAPFRQVRGAPHDGGAHAHGWAKVNGRENIPQRPFFQAEKRGMTKFSRSQSLLATLFLHALLTPAESTRPTERSTSS
jgi:hypothetical protein